MLPTEMVPYHVFGHECVNHEAQCPGCLKKFLVGKGVVYRTYFTLRNEEHYGHLAFCSLSCILLWVPDARFGHG